MKHILLIFSLVFASVAWSQDEDLELINIENPAVQAFLNDQTYDTNDDYKMSVVKKYVDKDKYGPNLNWPAGKTVSWNRSDLADGNRVRITVSTYEDFSANVSTFFPEDKVSSYIIRNNLPGLMYYYKVEEVNNGQLVKELSSGKYKTTGQLRMIRVAGVRNVRDMGGWTSSLGGFLQYGRMYRSAYFDNVTDEGRHDFVDNLGVTAELDQRGECRHSSSPLGDNVVFKNIVNDSYVGAMAGGKYRQAFVDDLRWLIARLKEGRNVNWHCHVGCDRCGTLSFLIGGVLGMSGPDLCRDYELSCFNGFNRPRSHVGFHKMIPWMEKQGAPGDDLTTCFEKYWLASGITTEEIEYLRSVMVVGYQHTTLAAPENNNDITTIVPDVEQGMEAQRPELIQNGNTEVKQEPAKVDPPKAQTKPAVTAVPDNQTYNENKVDTKATHPDQQIQSRTIYIHECPEQSMQSGKILATKLKITVNKQGKVTNATVDGSSKDKEFDLMAMRVANSLTGFTPATRKGQPVNSQFNITIKCNTQEVKQKAEVEAAKAAEQARLKAEQEAAAAKKKAEEEAARKSKPAVKPAPVITNDAAQKKAAEEAAAREAEAKRAAEQAAAKQAAEAAAAKEAAAKKAAAEEAARKKAAEDAAKRRAAKKKAEKEAAKKKAAEEAKKKAAEEARRKAAEAAKPKSHEVKEGESLYKIAQRNGVTVDELKRANGKKTDLLRPGDKLTIPKKKTTTSKKK